MTSTLPNFVASSVAAPAAGTGILVPSQQSGLTAGSAGHAASGGFLLEFAALLAGDGGPIASVAPGGTTPVIATANEGAPASPILDEVMTAPAAQRPLVPPGLAISAGAQAPRSEDTPVRPHGILRQEYEHAAAFVAALLQSLQTAAPVPTESTPTAPTDPETLTVELSLAEGVEVASTESAGVSPRSPTNLVLPNGRSFPTELPTKTKPGFESRPAETNMAAAPEQSVGEPAAPTGTAMDLVLPNGRTLPASLPVQAKVGFDRAPLPVAVSVPETASSEAPVSPPMTNIPHATPVAGAPITAAPVFAIAGNGAIECTVRQMPESSVQTDTSFTADAPMEVHAELELPGRSVVRVSVELPVAREHVAGLFERPENFAARNHSQTVSEIKPDRSVERNFVFTGDKQVKIDSPVSGIAVAQTENTMPVVPTEETRQPRNPETLSVLPVRADFQVAQPTAERITAEPAAPAGQNFAERAVATVTSLAEAQFSASLHRAGSVQLRLKFGGEDLTVRVELRDGVVHTDFRTDSPALREALATEWQAVAAASPGHLQRFLDPVFSPASSSGSTADSGSHQHLAHRQPQQQSQQEQPAHRSEAWASQSPFSRRSALGESFVPAPAAPRVPVLLPTSLRLSALA